MFRLVVIAALFSFVYAGAVPHDLSGRIVGGTNTTIEQHPHQVSLQNRTGYHFCGGSLISERYIVTAAHCLENKYASRMQVRVGTTFYNQGGEVIAVESFRNHQGYNTRTLVNDIAVIKLATPVQKTLAVGFIDVPREPTKNGAEAVVTGWGTTCFLFCSNPEYLLEVSVKIIDQDTCASDTYKYGSKIIDSMICAAEVKSDACQGDSGGPLVSDGKLVGVVSWGNSCASKNYPGVYTDVVKFADWIERTVAEL